VVVPSYHLSEQHWNTVALDGSVPDEEVLELAGRAPGPRSPGIALTLWSLLPELRR